MPEQFLKTLEEEGRLRTIPEEGDSQHVDLLSNDYMGLALRAGEFIDEFREMLTQAPEPLMFSSSASRLLSRLQYWPDTLENELAGYYHKSTLLFNSGYHANVGCLSAISNLDSTLILSDKLNHASAIDGLRLGAREVKRFPHNDISKLEKILERNADNYKRVIIVVEAVYSMDGDTAPLKQLVALKKKYSNLLIYLDEAHSFGVFGEKGLGLAEREGLIEDVDFLIGTFGKAAASAGAFVACPEEWKIYLLNSARSFIFSTALPPINYAWSLFMFRKLRTLSHERQVLAEKSLRFKKDIENITGKENPSCSQIIPYMVGDANKAIRLACFLQDKGFDVLPIRRPTVPPGGERLRFSLSAATQESELKRLISTLLLYKNKL